MPYNGAVWYMFVPTPIPWNNGNTVLTNPKGTRK